MAAMEELVKTGKIRFIGVSNFSEREIGQAPAAHPEQAEAIAASAAPLQRLIAQDADEKPEGGCQIQPGTEKDRVVSVEDQEMRHGRKSASQRFDGHKAAVAVGWRVI